MNYERYAEIRNSVGMKDFDVSKASGIGSSTFSDWKNGRSNPKEAKLRKIAQALGVTYAYLMGWESVSRDSSTMALEHIIQVNEENGGQSKMAQFLYDTTVKPAATSDKPHINVVSSSDIPTTSNVITDDEYNLILQYRNADDKVKDMIVQLLAYAVSKED